ncbi:phosphoglycerate mutase [Tetragenococcus halophilus subsp. flandriensis]|uniref:histidine phosphatase family protein n=1 Tax=Tetragenococcus halophilus TaxID=51669 RepID=UPI0023E9502E|nr:histidine phosphatase family protein [Tetragenococcus halophilus]GMA08673.1 phosphoglycerate mutase [Tetragenococcus halophilus subsp. flandriensis]
MLFKRCYSLLILFLGVIVLTGCQLTNTSQTETSNQEEKELSIYIMRHGETMLNTTDRVQGWSDAVLTPEGEEVVTSAGIGLKDIDFQSVYSSDSLRATQTAELVLDENSSSEDVQVQSDKRFREFNFGSYEGDLNHNMWQDISDEMEISLDDYLDVITPEVLSNHVYELDKERKKDSDLNTWPAENFEQIQNRLTAGLEEVVEKEQEKGGSGNILITTHGLSIEALMTTLFGEEYGKPDEGFKNASVSIIKHENGEFTLEEVGTLDFIEKGEAG